MFIAAQAQTPATSLKRVSDTKVASSSSVAIKDYKVSGSPTAPVTVELYTDYECPACRYFYLEILPTLTKDFVATGKVRLVHRDFRLPAHQFSKLATRYANAAGEIGKFDLVTNQLFVSQPEWGQNGNVDAAVAKVLSPADMEKVRNLVKNDAHLDDTAVRDEAMANTQDHLTETPTIVIVAKGKRESFGGGQMPYSILKQYLNQKLAQ